MLMRGRSAALYARCSLVAGEMYRLFRAEARRCAPLHEDHRREDAGAGRGVRVHVRSPEAPSPLSP